MGFDLRALPALEERCAGLTEAVRSTGDLTRLGESLDPSPFASTVRFRERSEAAAPLPDWWPEMAAMPVLPQVIADRVV